MAEARLKIGKQQQESQSISLTPIFKIKPALIINNHEKIKDFLAKQNEEAQFKDVKRKKKRKSAHSKLKTSQQSQLRLPKLTENRSKSKERSLNIKNQEKSTGHRSKRQLSQLYRQQCQKWDKDKYPLKYKVVARQTGIKDDQIYELKQGEVSQIQKDYLKQLGFQYLQENKHYIKRSQSVRTPNFKSYIHQIFQQPQPTKNSSHKHEARAFRTDRELKEYEQMQGNIVYQRVKEHLRAERQKPNYFHRVQTQSGVDSALVDFMKLKIIRAQSRLQ